jgi:hypothetical protein
MKLSSSDGSMIVIDKLTKARELIGEAFETIYEINNGTYRNGQEPKQFDFVSCPILSDKTDSLMDIIKKLDKYVYQENTR